MISAQRILFLVGSLLCAALLVHLYSQSDLLPRGHAIIPSKKPTPSNPELEQTLGTNATTATEHDDVCAGLEGLEDVVIILKTGASEIYSKLPIHFATTFACHPDFRIYSDLEQDFGRTKVRDALALVADETKTGDDFEQYRLLLKQVGTGGDASELKGERSWKIDKYKFLPMISDAYDEFGKSKKWFVFMEADTYISMYNLLLWLKELDPTSSVYSGAQILIGDTEFAHGGSGLLLSAPAAKSLTTVYRADQRGWERQMSGECCGDKVMGDVLMNANPPVGVLRSFPIIQGETPSSLDWSHTHWCMPAVS